LKVLYKLDVFEGPLDLLLHLIDKSEIDVYNIPIREITDQYMEYVQAMQELELDVASEFLVMAATLLSIKSKMLLPKPPVIELEDGLYEEEEIDPRAELVQRLLEYRKYKAIADMLREKEVERSLVYTREPEDLSPFQPKEPGNPVEGLHPADLLLALHRTLRRMTSRTRVSRIRRDEISVKDRMLELVAIFEKNSKMLFSKLFEYELTKEEVVVTFLALLELMKRGMVSCHQNRTFDDIVIMTKESQAKIGEGEPGFEIGGDEVGY